MVSRSAVGGGSLAISVNTMIFTSLHVVAEVGQAADVVVVDDSSSTSQPKMTVLVDRTCVPVVTVTEPEVESPNDVVVRSMVADLDSHDVGSDEYVGTLSFPILHIISVINYSHFSPTPIGIMDRTYVMEGHGGRLPEMVMYGGN